MTSPRSSPISSPTRHAACPVAWKSVRRSRRERADVSAFTKHSEELERHETMMGSARGRLAVALDLLTDALAMVGQHGIYCQSARMPGRPTMDIGIVLDQIGDAKELVQSVMELER